LTCLQDKQLAETEYLALFKVELLKASYRVHPQSQIICSLGYKTLDFAGEERRSFPGDVKRVKTCRYSLSSPNCH